MVEYFEIGHISNTHGLKGEMKIRPFTKENKDYAKLNKILIDFNGKLEEYTVETVRYQKDIVLLKLKEVNDIEEAERLKGHYIKIPRELAKKVDKDEYFIADLLGSEVYQHEVLLGILDDVFTAGGSDVYVVKRKSKQDLLLPAISSVVKKVDIENKQIFVEVPRGLDDEIWCFNTFSWAVWAC